MNANDIEEQVLDKVGDQIFGRVRYSVFEATQPYFLTEIHFKEIYAKNFPRFMLGLNYYGFIKGCHQFNKSLHFLSEYFS